MNVIYKSKSQVREETSEALQQFLARGGKIEIVKSRKAPTTKMRGKSSRGFQSGTAGFASGFPKRSFGA